MDERLSQTLSQLIVPREAVGDEIARVNAPIAIVHRREWRTDVEREVARVVVR